MTVRAECLVRARGSPQIYIALASFQHIPDGIILRGLQPYDQSDRTEVGRVISSGTYSNRLLPSSTFDMLMPSRFEVRNKTLRQATDPADIVDCVGVYKTAR
jgi:hypothetical protein